MILFKITIAFEVLIVILSNNVRVKVYKLIPGFIQFDYVNPEYGAAKCGMYFYNRTAKYADSNFTIFKELKRSFYVAVDIFVFMSNEYRIFPPACFKVGAHQIKYFDQFNTYTKDIMQGTKPPLKWPPKVNVTYRTIAYTPKYATLPIGIGEGRYKCEMSGFQEGNKLYKSSFFFSIEHIV